MAGLLVTTIVVLGCDMDVVYAVPLGLLAGAVATFCVALSEERQKVRVKG
ncbi:MAG TPA: hypothetical protein VMH86_07575 [Rhizomicrobium sp.]|nr:hypothetical protein [Rhizomicrobium sp.]